MAPTKQKSRGSASSRPPGGDRPASQPRRTQDQARPPMPAASALASVPSGGTDRLALAAVRAPAPAATGTGTDMLITGLPRSGTTLSLVLLGSLPNTVAIDEGLRGAETHLAHSPDTMATVVRRFLRDQRNLALEEGQVWTNHTGGNVVSNGFAGQRGDRGRVRSVEQGWVDVGKPLTPDFTLLLKQPVIFTAVLQRMTQQWPVLSVVRNPLAALGSWNSVAFGMQEGRAAIVDRFHPDLKRLLDALPNRTDRQITLMHWFFEQFARYLPADAVIKYEEVVETRGAALGRVVPAAADLQADISSRNRSNDYDLTTMLELGERLLRSDGAAWNFYSRAEVGELLDSLVSGGITKVR